MTVIGNHAEWWSDAACSSADPDLFFPISPSGPALRQVAQAKALCTRCHVQQACLGYALDAGPVQGIRAERRRQSAGCSGSASVRPAHVRPRNRQLARSSRGQPCRRDLHHRRRTWLETHLHR